MASGAGRAVIAIISVRRRRPLRSKRKLTTSRAVNPTRARRGLDAGHLKSALPAHVSPIIHTEIIVLIDAGSQTDPAPPDSRPLAAPRQPRSASSVGRWSEPRRGIGARASAARRGMAWRTSRPSSAERRARGAVHGWAWRSGLRDGHRMPESPRGGLGRMHAHGSVGSRRARSARLCVIGLDSDPSGH